MKLIESLRDKTEGDVIDAVDYAMRSGCFFPVREPRPGATVRQLVKWGAMRNLHTKFAALATFDALEQQP